MGQNIDFRITSKTSAYNDLFEKICMAFRKVIYLFVNDILAASRKGTGNTRMSENIDNEEVIYFQSFFNSHREISNTIN